MSVCTKYENIIEGGQFCIIYIHKNFEFKIRDDFSINCKDIESVNVELLH